MNLDQFQKQTQRQRSVPKLRFPGFSDPWERRKLGELVEIGDIDHLMPKSVVAGIPYLMTGDFCGINSLNFDGVKMVSEDDYYQLSKKIKPEKGDIIFARYASVGTARYIDFTRKFLISYSCAIIKMSSKINSKYLYHFITSNYAQRQIRLEVNTGSQANIGIDSMKNNIIVSLPQPEEQTKIADTLSYFDSLITFRQRKIDILKQYKTGVEDSLFSKISTTKKIKDIIEILPKTNHPAGVGQSKGVYRFYTNNSTAQLYFNTYDYNAEAIVSNTGGDAHFEYHNGKFAASMHCMTFTSNINTKYLYYILSYFVNRINFEGFRGNGLKCLDKSWFANFDVTVPDIDKQNEIASILSEIDMLLEKETYILNRLKLLKQGLLQQMFT